MTYFLRDKSYSVSANVTFTDRCCDLCIEHDIAVNHDVSPYNDRRTHESLALAKSIINCVYGILLYTYDILDKIAKSQLNINKVI